MSDFVTAWPKPAQGPLRQPLKTAQLHRAVPAKWTVALPPERRPGAQTAAAARGGFGRVPGSGAPLRVPGAGYKPRCPRIVRALPRGSPAAVWSIARPDRRIAFPGPYSPPRVAGPKRGKFPLWSGRGEA